MQTRLSAAVAAALITTSTLFVPAAVADDTTSAPLGRVMGTKASPVDTRVAQLYGAFNATGGRLSETGVVPIRLDQVRYDVTDPRTRIGDVELSSIINDAADLNGVPDDPDVRARWQTIMRAVGQAESSNNPMAVNDWDANAVGSTRKDGYPFQCSRGIWQLIPQTFAAYHVSGTSYSIYDPQASAAAAMAYMIGEYGMTPGAGGGMDGFATTRGIDIESGGPRTTSYVGY